MEFARRHEICKARANEEMEKQVAVKNVNARQRRAVQMSGDTEETKDEVIEVNLKPYNAEKARATCFFTKATANDILDAIKGLLEDTGT